MDQFESNPFRGHPPNALDELSPEVARFLEDQQLALRGFASKVQAGALSLPGAYLTQAVATAIYPLGVEAQFQTSDGILRGRLMELPADLRARTEAVGVYTKNNVTALASGSGYEFAGIVLPTESPTEAPYAWVVYRGVVAMDSGITGTQALEWVDNSWTSAASMCHAYSIPGGKVMLRWPAVPLAFDDSAVGSIAERLDALETMFSEAGIQEFKEYTTSALLEITEVLGGADFTRAIEEQARLNEYVASVTASIETMLQVATTQNETGNQLLEAFGIIESNITALVTEAQTQVQSVTQLGAQAAYYEEQTRENAIATSHMVYDASVSKDLAGLYSARAEAALGLMASLGGNALNLNSTFLWDIADSLPDDWASHKKEGTSTYTRVVNEFGRTAVRMTANLLAEEIGLKQEYTGGLASLGVGWYVLEAKVKLISGSLNGAGLILFATNSAGVSQQTFNLDFTTDTSWYGVAGGGEPGRRYYYAKLIQMTDVDITKGLLLAMGNAETWTESPKVIDFERVSLRLATQAEIDTGLPAGPLEAEVTQNSQAVADIYGSAAFYEVLVAAGGGFPAIVRMTAGQEGSEIDIAAKKISVYTEDSGGAVSELARFEDGVATIYGTLRVDSIETEMVVGQAITNTIYTRGEYLSGFTSPQTDEIIETLSIDKQFDDSVLDISYYVRTVQARAAVAAFSIDAPGLSKGTGGYALGSGRIDHSDLGTGAFSGGGDSSNIEGHITTFDTGTGPTAGIVPVDLVLNLSGGAIGVMWYRFYVTERKR